ncbi:MAG TPA: glycosyltransferase family 87 protein [Pirellulaceae bacterium]|nr:glycosyltransferase family 87 protein [Pirellulaceae bacterium]
MKAWQDLRVIALVFFAIATIASLSKYARPTYDVAGTQTTHYNNYVIYRNSAQHLSAGVDLYQYHPDKQHDLYLYSPTFAAAFTPLAWLPDVLGLCLWNGLNAVLLAYALRSLPIGSCYAAGACWLALKDLLTSLQNSQANGLVAALMVLTFVCWQQKQLSAAALCLAMATFVKPFGLACALFWLMFPRKPRFAGLFVASTAALIALPLLFTSPDGLRMQYESWFARLQVMHGLSAGISVMGILETWFGLTNVKLPTLALGMILLVAPLLRVRQHGNLKYQLSMLASILIWVVIFNHEAESPTFVIATTGVAIWFCSRPITLVNSLLMGATVLVSGFSRSDLTPQWLQDEWIGPYHWKAVPAIAVWIKLQIEMWLLPLEAAALQSISEPAAELATVVELHRAA